MVNDLSLRLVPDALWEMVEPLVPQFTVRPQGGGSAPVDDRAVFTAIVFVLTSGCAWRHLPPCFGVTVPTAHRRFTTWSNPDYSSDSTGKYSTTSAVPVNSTGRQRSWTRQASGQKGGITDRSESGRPRQERIEDPCLVRREWNPAGRRRISGQYP